MIYLLPDTSGQVVIMTLSEGRHNLPSSFSDYLIEFRSQSTSEKHYTIPAIAAENDKWTQLLIDTSGIEESGDYEYRVFGQNSPTNLDPNDSSVVSEVESGLAIFASNVTYDETLTPVIPPSVER